MTLSASLKRYCAISRRRMALAGVILWMAVLSRECPADESEAHAGTNTFPSVAEVLGGQTFENDTEQDIYFLRAIHDRYASHWSDLLEANITLKDFVLSPEKLLRFVNELGEAMRDHNDPAACANLTRITGDASFYANTNVDHPEIIQAAAQALIKIGPEGRKALASSFTESHYCNDPGSLEDLADAVGEAQVGGSEFIGPLADTAFNFATTNGAIYPRCITAAVKNLLSLKEGPAVVQAHLNVQEVLDNPGRFQAVVDGIAAVQSVPLTTNLMGIQVKVRARLADLANSPGGYRDDLQELNVRIGRTLASAGKRK